MKRDDIKELHQKDITDLVKMLDALKADLAQARLGKAARKPVAGPNPSRIADDIARIKTVIRHKELTAPAGVAPQKEDTETTQETKPTKETKKK